MVTDPFEGAPFPSKERTALYRHFDAEGKLLYVGISMSAMARMCQHKQAEYTWTDTIANMTIEWFDYRYLALRAEKEAIQKECPSHNIIHKTGSTK